MTKNGVGREIPKYIEGYGETKLYDKPFSFTPQIKKNGKKIRTSYPGDKKLVSSIESAIESAGLKDGMTISFHHHLRNGDYIINMVMKAISEMGYRDITVAASSLNTRHAPLLEYIKDGTITGIETSGLREPLGEAVSNGLLAKPAIIRSHGGRARAIESGELKIDIAFLGVPAADEYGNANGYSGESICGSLGYALIDAQYAEKVVLITDNLVKYPCIPASIQQTDVDIIVEVESIGNPEGIVSGAIKGTKNPKDILIAENALQAILHSGYFKDGFSFQTGAAGATLAVTNMLRDKMIEYGIRGSFGLGGITAQLVQLLEEDLFDALFDVQSFDLVAAESVGKNAKHFEISSSFYANPHNSSPVVNNLDIVLLGALEVDTKFNVNVITGSDGVISQASGGHSDTAAGSKLSIILAPLIRGRIPIVVDNVTTVVTPGETVDVIVTEYGIAVNPLRADLIEKYTEAGLKLYSIEELKAKAEKITGIPEKIEFGDKVVGVIEYRDGSVIDVVWNTK